MADRGSTVAKLFGIPLRGLRRLVRERRFLVHDGAHTRHFTLTTFHQIAFLSAIAALVGWASYATSAYVEGRAAAVSRDSEITRRVSELDGIKASYRAAFDRLDEFQKLFADVTCEINDIQGSLLRVAERSVAPDHRAGKPATSAARGGAAGACAAADLAKTAAATGVPAPTGGEGAASDTSRIVGALHSPDQDAVTDRVASFSEALARLRQTHTAFLRESADIAAQRVGELERALSRVGVDANRLAAANDTRRADPYDQPKQRGTYYGTTYGTSYGTTYGTGGPFIAAPKAQAPEPSFDAATLFSNHADRLDTLILALRSLPLAAPLDSYEVTSPFGTRDDPFNEMAGFHEGVDFGAPVGSPVLATGDGVVVWAGWRDRYGNLVELDHGRGLTTRYAHLQRVLVHVGDRVLRGRPIGLLGNTGRSTGPHLHYEVRVNDQATDPLKFITAGRDVLKTQ